MKQFIAKVGAGIAVLATPAITFAQSSFQPGDISKLREFLTPLRAPDGPLSIEIIAIQVLNFVILIAAILAIFYLIWAGIQYITASTDEEKAKKARAGIYNAVIGIVVILLSYVIVQYVSRLTAGALNNVQTGGTTGGNPFITQ